MCTAIQEFDKQHNEEVNMRVGVHTGDVLCGIVGSRRFKFDVFSNDVTLANMMESTGWPGRVHVSDTTKSFLNDEFVLEPGPQLKGNSANYTHHQLHAQITHQYAPNCCTHLLIALHSVGIMAKSPATKSPLPRTNPYTKVFMRFK